MRIDRDGMHREFVGRAEDANGDFLKMHEVVRGKDHAENVPHGLRRGFLLGVRRDQLTCGAWFGWSAPACQVHWGWRRRWVRV